MSVDETMNIGGYSNVRRLTTNEKSVVRALAEAGSSTSSILSYLKNNLGNQWTTRTEIDNEKAAERKAFLDGKSSVQALFEIITNGDFIYDMKVDENECPGLYRAYLAHIKGKIIGCWTDQYLHFGTTSTSRGEGNHFMLKKYLKIANGDLLTVLKNLEHLLAAQFTDLNAAMESEKIFIAHRHKLDFMHPFVKKISQFALDKMLRQYERVTQIGDNEAYADMFRKICGIPCQHVIMDKMEGSGGFDLHDFHSQWHFHQNPIFTDSGGASNEAPLSPRRKE
ncbi:hypothetical protein PsorP6_010898 [Peronosclerospora sorghi]|uniref:Uncharacterized protein n=1 Tax=Peronosclerospora sorghi TaxID=230839 RepID=A0ACC0VZU1_9STRA|nr:hypothetical protein PsorP6_010898 [Peronosclerospora sorghi]